MGFLDSGLFQDAKQIFGEYTGSNATREANEANIKMAKEQQVFQERMSNSAHQREVDDLRKAGLNPILSANGGASSPAGSLPNIVPEDDSRGIQSAISTALESSRLKKDIREADSRINLNDQSKATAKAQEKLLTQNAKTAELNAEALKSQMGAIKSRAKADQKEAEIDEKMIGVDAVMKRLSEGMGLMNRGRDLITPDILKKTRKGTIYNRKTGEVYE